MIATGQNAMQAAQDSKQGSGTFNGVRRVDGAKYVVREERRPASVPPAD